MADVGHGLGDVSCNLQPARYEGRRKMSMRAMMVMIMGMGITLRETTRERALGDSLRRCNLQSV